MGGTPGGAAGGTAALGELLSPAELAVLARAGFALRRPRLLSPGGHLARRAGASLEFADHRPYQPGDDPRLVDWAVYARHRKLVTKVFSREVEAPLYVLLDASRSMAVGGKFPFAARLSAAFCFLAYRAGDRFAVYLFSETVQFLGKPRRGRTALAKTFAELSRISPEGRTDLARALSNWAERIGEPGVCLILSDFLAPGFREGLLALRYGRHAVAALQILAPQDLSPSLAGEVRLLDVEEGRGRSLVVGRAALKAYGEALRRWNAALLSVCQEFGAGFFLFPANGSPVAAALTVAQRWRP